MKETSGPNTIFFSLKLKRTISPMEVFEKMKKIIKKKGPTKNWDVFIDEKKEEMIVDFGDHESESFCISFNDKKSCESFCKVYFPLNGEFFDNESKSEFKALLNMIWSARTMFSEMSITDDYGLSNDFLESKKYKLSLRELTIEEHAFAEKIYHSGAKLHTDFILAIIYKQLNMLPDEKWFNHINIEIPFAEDDLNDTVSRMWGFWETYIYETAEYKNIRVKDNPDFRGELNGLWFSVHAMSLMIDELYHYHNYFRHDDHCSFGVKHAQLRRFYKDKVYPLLDKMPDGYEKCCLAYRFFLSAYAFCGFKYIGKENDVSNYRYLCVSKL